MASIAFQMTSTPLTGTKSFTGTDADMQALLDWAKVAYASVITELFNPTNAPGFTPTNTQIGVGLATGTMRAWKDAVQKAKADAAVAALVQPAHITFA